MTGNVTQVHVEFTYLEVENFCVAQFMLAHHRLSFDEVRLMLDNAQNNGELDRPGSSQVVRVYTNCALISI